MTQKHCNAIIELVDGCSEYTQILVCNHLKEIYFLKSLTTWWEVLYF